MALTRPQTSGSSFEELLIERGLLTEEKLQKLLLSVTRDKKSLEQLLLESGFPDEKIAALKAECLGYEFVNVSSHPSPPSDLLRYIKPAYAKNYRILPIKYENGVLTIAMVEPREFITLEEVIRIYRDSNYKIRNIKLVVTTPSQLNTAIDKFYVLQTKKDGGIGSIMAQVEESFRPDIEAVQVAREEVSENSAPIVMLANRITEEAHRRRSSDIHLEPALNCLRVRYRIDGELTEVMRIPKYAQNALITRLKIMADLRIDERRVPQDGRINFTKYNPAVDIDIRVSTIPTPNGEDVVMRILDKKSSILSLDMLGFNEHNMKLYKDAISAPYGIILHVGPTGSGKTTALYAALKHLDTLHVKIVTAEDPVEYTLGGQIIQSNINPAAGYTFAKAIRAFMRHDPDIILIGEIRDLETAKTAVEASLTGHLVFSTLHTNDAIGTVTRLTEIGVETYLVGDSLLLVCAQRLVRKICPKCKESYVVTNEEVELAKDIKPGMILYRGKGCKECEGMGYKGRIGIYEVLSMDRRLKSLLLKGATTEEIRTVAMKSGMRTLRQDAKEKALKGVTSLEEVINTTLAEE